MKKLLTGLMSIFLKLVPLRVFLALWHRALHIKLQTLEPKEALSSLLYLDNFLYTQTGRYAIPYNNGVHVKQRLTGYVDHFTVLAKEVGGPFLDIGCGKGELAHAIASHTEEQVVGIDILKEKIEATQRLEKLPNLEYILGDATKVDLEQRFKTIVLSNVFEHIANRHDFLLSLVSKYNPEKFLIRVPCFERDWRVPLKKELGVEWRLDITHETEHTPLALTQELEGAGLHVLHQEIRWGEIWAIAEPVKK